MRNYIEADRNALGLPYWGVWFGVMTTTMSDINGSPVFHCPANWSTAALRARGVSGYDPNELVGNKWFSTNLPWVAKSIPDVEFLLDSLLFMWRSKPTGVWRVDRRR